MTASNIHASCVVLARSADAFGAPADAGVLLLGESGSGKSRTALQLIARGAVLVADDRVELFARDGRLWARAPSRLAGLIEVRGLGIVALPFVPEARIALAVKLVPAARAPRMSPREDYEPPASIPLRDRPPLLRFSEEDVTVQDKIVLAAAAFANALFREESNPP
jgi:hypothetical protein